MTVAIYIRVSTDEQAEQGYSLDAQKERLISYCHSQGWNDYKIYMDDGYTGTNINRPALKRMIRHIEDGKINGVLVYKLDRLSRKQKDVLALIEDVFEKHNVSFTSSMEKIDTSSAFGKAVLGVLAVFAQLDRDMIVERTTLGRRQRISMGKWYGGRVPFGYSWNKELQQLEINDSEARIVREIFKMYIDGHSKLEISEWASSRTDKRIIDHSTIRDIIARPIYKGVLSSSGKEFEGKHSAIVDSTIWDAAQLETRKRMDGATTLGEYLLTGLLQCGKCGSGIVHVKRKTQRNNKEYLYELYACKQQHVRYKDRKTSCNLGYIKRETIESFVVSKIKGISLDPLELKKRMQDESGEDDLEKVMNDLQSQLKGVLGSLENLYDAIQSGDIKASSVSERIRKLEEQRDSIENDIDDIIGGVDNTINVDEAITMVCSIGEAWDFMTEEEQKKAIRRVIKKVTLAGKNIDPEIDWIFS